jgi:hypothetical protein
VRLTRRDALVSLAAGGAVAGGLSLSASHAARTLEFDDDDPLTEAEVATAVAVADAVYPSAVEGVPAFVEAYVGRLRPSRREAVGAAAGGLDRRARDAYGAPFATLSRGDRETLLREIGVDRVVSKPEGTLAERIRYHLVNTLLYALFTSPTGSELVGIENPVGHPGGYDTYGEEP